MKQYFVTCRETVTRTYTVEAETEAEARSKMENGDTVYESPGETIDCEILSIKEDK